MPKTAYSRDHKLQLWMNEHEMSCLKLLSDQWKISMSEVMRRLVVNEVIVQQRINMLVEAPKKLAP